MKTAGWGCARSRIRRYTMSRQGSTQRHRGGYRCRPVLWTGQQSIGRRQQARQPLHAGLMQYQACTKLNPELPASLAELQGRADALAADDSARYRGRRGVKWPAVMLPGRDGVPSVALPVCGDQARSGDSEGIGQRAVDGARAAVPEELHAHGPRGGPALRTSFFGLRMTPAILESGDMQVRCGNTGALGYANAGVQRQDETTTADSVVDDRHRGRHRGGSTFSAPRVGGPGPARLAHVRLMRESAHGGGFADHVPQVP